MFKLPHAPSPQAGVHQLADFAELLCWSRGSTSEREIIACLGRIDDNDNNVGCTDDDDENGETLIEVMNEIERRAVACGSGYPFRLEMEGSVLHLEDGAQDTAPSIVYLYLLLSTRLNMKDNRVHAGLDGTRLLETLSAHVLKNYLGNTRAKAVVFGTSQPGTFEEKVNGLCRDLSEGEGFRNLDQTATQAKDDKLDTVGWVPFSDRLPGQLIVFGQCKTGSNWRDATAQLQPESFVKSWIRGTILVNPVRACFIAEAADRARWKSDSVNAGILFDRCRLVDWCDGVAIDDIKKWALAAKDTLDF
ncbi:MAG: hypothetical protein JXA57_09545 [Armatimonadetes bacterium]|nr:hypothetical protein [Armatimonadota bacterium]